MTTSAQLLQGPTRRLGDRVVGPGHPVYITGEIGINHNGELSNAFALIDQAAAAGCDAVKFQKRTPEICTPRDQWDIERDTPWGRMTYIDYRHRVEFGVEEYGAIAEHARKRGIHWFASPWDTESVDFLEQFDVPAHKVASASLTDDELLRKLRATGRTIILSTGMSTMKQIRHAVEVLGSDNIVLCHATSTYPAPAEQLNLRMIHTLQGEFPNVPIGYSGHETGLQTTLAAVALGAVFVERVFAWPGMGQLAIAAVSRRDYWVVTACSVVVSAMVAAGTLLADVLHAAADPRLRDG